MDFLIGVDGGGTKTKVRMETLSGERIGEAIGGPGNIKTSVFQSWQSINSALEALLQGKAIDLNDPVHRFHAVMGMAGVESRAAQEQFLAVPHPFAHIELVSDAHVACLGAHAGQDGAIIIVGTGVIGYHIEQRHAERVAGWGFPHADEGGGAWLGMEALRRTLQYADGRAPASPLLVATLERFGNDPTRIVTFSNGALPSHYGDIAPMVVEYAEQQDPHAVALMQQAGQHVSLVWDTLIQKQQHPEQPLPCVLLGGVAPFVLPYIDAKLRAYQTERQAGPTEGAILMLRKQLG